jgi:hypothetical protein
MRWNLKRYNASKCFGVFLPHRSEAFLGASLVLIVLTLSGCVNDLFYTWEHELAASSPQPLVWRSDWPVSKGKVLPIAYYFDRDRSVKVQIQPQPSGPIVTEWGRIGEARPASALNSLPPGSTAVWLTLPEGPRTEMT